MVHHHTGAGTNISSPLVWQWKPFDICKMYAVDAKLSIYHYAKLEQVWSTNDDLLRCKQ